MFTYLEHVRVSRGHGLPPDHEQRRPFEVTIVDRNRRGTGAGRDRPTTTKKNAKIRATQTMTEHKIRRYTRAPTDKMRQHSRREDRTGKDGAKRRGSIKQTQSPISISTLGKGGGGIGIGEGLPTRKTRQRQQRREEIVHVYEKVR